MRNNNSKFIINTISIQQSNLQLRKNLNIKSKEMALTLLKRSIILFFLLFFIIHNAVGQNIRKSVLERKYYLNLLILKTKLLADSIYNIDKFNSIEEIDKLKIDSSSHYSYIQPDSKSCDQLICSEFNLPHVIKPLGWTSDYEKIFTKEQINELDSIIADFEKQSSNEIAIISIDSSWTTIEKFDNLTISIGEFWGVGKKDINNGIVIGISKGLRKIRISNGYGIEEKLTDEETKKIINDIIIPYFKKGMYFEGIKKGLSSIMQEIR